MMKFYEDFRQRTSGDKVTCLNCGAVNSAEQTNCENCERPLERPASLAINALETVIRPMRAMPRIAATTPVKQAFLVVLAMIAVYVLLGTFSILTFLQGILNNLDDYKAPPGSTPVAAVSPAPTTPGPTLATPGAETSPTAAAAAAPTVTPTANQRVRESLTRPGVEPPLPGPILLITQFLFLFLSWIFFSLALFYGARLFYRGAARSDLLSLLSVTGFARLANLGGLLYFLPLGEFAFVFQILTLVWQLGLLLIGVRASTGLTWGRAAILTLIPTVLFVFILQLPI